MANGLEQAKAREQIINSIRDLVTLKITLPLGNPNFKLLHTNQFLWTELPEDVFELANMDSISKALNGSYSRYSGYVLNRWYIEAITIKNNSSDGGTIELELNPFATDFNDYQSEYRKYSSDYSSMISSANNNSSNKTNSTSVKSVTTTNKTLAGGEGKTIDNLARKIVGNITDDLEKSKAVHNWALKNLKYSSYKNCKFCTPNKCYSNRTKLNCADTSILVASILRSAGVDCYIVHSPNHYYVVLSHNGKLYCTDPVGSSRKFNYYWTPTNRAVKFKGKSSYNSKCGKKPC